MQYNNYTIEKYKKDIDNKGLNLVWKEILEYSILNDTKDTFLDVNNFGELYEIGLAHKDKKSKKEQGVYYTPIDVADLLSNYLKELRGSNICDVCCGTGNLILSYLKQIGRDKAIELLKQGKLYLYDMDTLALEICRTSIGIIYGKMYLDKINCIEGDFLDKNIHLPENAKVISNPPYFKIKKVLSNWNITEVIQDSKECYSAFMEKIIKESVSSVIITPFSFIGGDKFYSLRKILNDYNGFIISFDNVPGNIFKGKKHGIFNTNTSNAVRAAITVVENSENKKGFRISPLLRFSSNEREKLLNNVMLNSFLNDEYQIVSNSNKEYYKCFNELLPVFKTWVDKSNSNFNSLLSKDNNEYILNMPKTCRYFVSATNKELKRTGKTLLHFKDRESFEFAYCLLNSSFAYLYWRIYEGAITYSDSLLKSMPIFIDKLSKVHKEEIHKIVSKMISEEENYLVYKKNASEMQENVKFPITYRDELNLILLDVLNVSFDIRGFDKVHSNSIFMSNTDLQGGKYK